jgi:preprotein translocase subunit SecG
MQVLFNLVLGVQILSALAIIGLVLVQHGKGADMGASFGSGSSGSLFGASGSANFLSRATAVAATVFFICTLGLAYSSHERAKPTGETLLDRANAATPAASAASGAAQIPVGAASLPAAASAAAPNASGAAAIPKE